jgi:signal peptidase I
MLKKLINFSNSWTGTIVIVLLVIFFVAQAFVIPSGSMKKTLLVGDHLFVKKFSYGIPIPKTPGFLGLPSLQVLPDFFGNGHLIEGDKPERGDIVVFLYPHDTQVHYVKRCLALGGDEIIYQDKHLYLRFHEGDAYMKENFPKEKLHTLGGKLWVLNPFEDKFKGIQYDQDVDLFARMRKSLAAGKLDMKPAIIEELPKSMNSDFNAFYVKVPENEFYMIGDNRDNSYDSRFWGSVPYSLIVGQPWFVYFSWDEDYKVRWNRIGRFIDTIENSTEFLDGK